MNLHSSSVQQHDAYPLLFLMMCITPSELDHQVSSHIKTSSCIRMMWMQITSGSVICALIITYIISI